MEQAFDELPQFVFVKNQDFQIVYLNKSLANFFGWNRSEIVGKTDMDLFEPSMALDHRKEDERVLFEGEKVVSELRRHIGDDNTVRWIRTQKTLVVNDKGERFVLGISMDLTREREQIKEADELQRFESVIQRISNSLFGIDNEEDVCWQFVTGALSVLELDDLVLYLSDNDRGVLKQVAALSGEKAREREVIEPREYSFSQGIVGRCAREQKVQWVNDTRLDSAYIVDDQERLSELAVPLVANGELIGVLDSENKAPNFFTKIHRDVFEASAGILALKITELRYFKLLENTRNYLNEILESPKNLVVFSLDTRYRYKAFNTNHANIMKAIWGKDIELEHNMLEYISKKEDRIKAKNNFDRALKGEEFTLVEAYGDEHLQRSYWEDFYSPQKDSKGNVVGLTVFVRDVSKELNYQKALKESQGLLQSVTSNIREGVCRASIEEGFLYTNNAMTRMFGYDKEQFQELELSRILCDPEQANNVVNQLRSKDKFENKELLWRRKDGSSFWGLLNCLGYEKGNDYIIDASILDITEIRMAQDELRNKVVELEKLNSELDHLVYRTSHDLRAPVASLLGLIELTGIDENFNPDKFREILVSQVKRLDVIIRDIIAYRKIAIKGRELKTVDLEKLINQAIKDNEFTEGSQSVRKELVINNEGNYNVVADQFGLNIVLNNLISNAIKYSDLKKPNPYVRIQADIEKTKVTIRVDDNGEGINSKYHHRLFEMFYRATNSSFGSGLGLFILKEAMQKMGGIVDFESELGVGSTFRIELPNYQ